MNKISIFVVVIMLFFMAYVRSAKT
ncbi:MAG: hypothetical protein JRF35_12790 [Deltaproteobacteria bacterium]|nr:hypothetical protein [Deltaproteobacteria bacterium]